MSRVGKKPIAIPPGVEVRPEGNLVRVKGPRGELRQELTGPIDVKLDGSLVVVRRRSEDKQSRALHGLYRALVANMVTGVTEGFEKVLEIIGVGYRAEIQEKKLKLHVGYAVPYELDIPEGLEVETGRGTRPGVDYEVRVRGIDKQLVGQFAANVRAVRPPDVYKGKGIRYRGEYVRKLAGKTFGSTR